MAIETTLNIHKSVLKQIQSAAHITGCSNNELIIRLLKRAVKEYTRLYFKGTRRIKYQDRDEKKNWETHHVTYTEIEYDYVLDIKKLYKMSVSNIFAYMVRHFLKKVIYEIMITKTTKKSDNYRLTSYAVVHKKVKNSICWKIYWGIPHPPDLLYT